MPWWAWLLLGVFGGGVAGMVYLWWLAYRMFSNW
jgi:hypothetical protein